MEAQGFRCGLTVLALALVACGKPDAVASKITIRCEVSPRPARVGQLVVAVTLTSPAGEPITAARVRIEGDMSHAGMAPVFADAGATGSGHYQARLPLTMPGDWVILSHVTLPNGAKVDRQMDLPGVLPAADEHR